MMEKEALIDAVKREAKKVIEEAVTKKFVHVDSSCVTSLCGSIDCCITHGLKKRIGGLLPAATSEDVLTKLAKFNSSADAVLQLFMKLSHNNLGSSNGPRFNLKEVSSPEKRMNGYNVSGSQKFLLIRLALVEKVLVSVLSGLCINWREFYEPDALFADQLHGSLLLSLLDGPASLEYSKMKAPDSFWFDPPADELVLRHRIYSSSSHNSYETALVRKRRLFTDSCSKPDTLHGVPHHARDHVESLHQNPVSTLLYGKNNVVLGVPGGKEQVQGYLSLHKSADSLLLKWTPNLMLTESDDGASNDKSKFWDQALTVDFADIVFIHCHHAGDSEGGVVLIGQDGIQLPPLGFPSAGSLLAFLTCLEQGLHPEGRLDPPLFNKESPKIDWPRLKKTVLPGKQSPAFDEAGNRQEESQDYVFRIIVSANTSNLDKKDLQLLLSRQSLPKKLNPTWLRSRETRKALLPKLHTGSRLSHQYRIPTRITLQLACEKMKHQIMSRAFHGWLAHYRNLKTIRTHLALLVLPRGSTPPLPEDADRGLTRELWSCLQESGLGDKVETIMQYVYCGGVEHGLRKEVWPFLLDPSKFTLTRAQGLEFEQSMVREYGQLLEQCKVIELYLQEKEKDILTLNGFPDGDAFGSPGDRDVDGESLQTLDMTEGDIVDGMGETAETASQDASLDSNISEPVTLRADVSSAGGQSNTDEFSLIASIVETKESLREMVQKASKRGAETWLSILSRTREKRKRRRSTKHAEFADSFSPQADTKRSFDLELSCHSCGMTIVESRERLLERTRSDSGRDSVECYACAQEQSRKLFEDMHRAFQKTQVGLTARADTSVKTPSLAPVNADCVSPSNGFSNGGLAYHIEEPWERQHVPVVNGGNLSLDNSRSCSPVVGLVNAADDVRHHENVTVINGGPLSLVEAKPCSPVEVDHADGTRPHERMALVNGDISPRSGESCTPLIGKYSDDVLKEFALNIHRIDKDVLRCDRNYAYFALPENLAKLRNVMICYVWERLNVGYIQGMCDLCAPLLVILDDEPRAHACFVKLMERMEHNFPHGPAMDEHLANMRSLIQILDPELHEVMEMHGENSMFYFCYRWFLLDFKRELQYEDVFSVWETIWAASHVASSNFSLFFALAVIELYREIVIDNQMEFTDVIKFFNEMAERHDAGAALNLARDIICKLQDIMHPEDAFDT